MNDYLIDYEVLAKFIDKLIAEKYPNQPTAELQTLREDSIRKLDDKIGKEILGALTDEQGVELDRILDDPSATPEAYREFFNKSGINVEQRMASIMQNFAQEFLGGKNA